MKRRVLLALLAVCCLASGLTGAGDGVFDSNGVKIRYVTEGTGEPVVLIHGWMADSGMWGRDRSGNTKPNAAGAEGFQLIALDCRGHGQSGKPHDPEQYGAEMAADVVRLLDHLKIKKAHLVGYSMGAFIAGKVDATHPKRVLSVVYGGQAPLVAGLKSTGSSEVDVFAKPVDEGGDLGSYIIAVTPPGKPKPTEAQASAMARFMFGAKDVKALAAAGRGFEGLEVTPKQLRKCKVEAQRETDYYADQGDSARTIDVLVVCVALLAGVGAVLGATNTLYAAVQSRRAEIGTLRALGFSRAAILVAFQGEALLLGLVGGLIGLFAASFMQMVPISTSNFQTFSEIAFSFTLTPEIVAASLGFALLMGFVGGFLPAARAARLKIVDALRAA